MRFSRVELSSVDLDRVRATAARRGWLVESPLCLRAGFGDAVVATELPAGLEGPLGAADVLSGIEVDGPGNASRGPLAFASAPFDRSAAVRVWVPEHTIVASSEGITLTTTGDPDRVLTDLEIAPSDLSGYRGRTTGLTPSPDGYAQLVALAVGRMHHSPLRKVVLARRLDGEAPETIDPAVVAERLRRREPACTLFAVPDLDGGRFVGASPELIVACSNGDVLCHPLAGTVALPEDGRRDDYESWLLSSAKNNFEHRVVVDDIVARLSRRCENVQADRRPSIVQLRSIAHLGTWIRGKIDHGDPLAALELLSLLHPTPAVGGLPGQLARQVIAELEPVDRGLYAGAVGAYDARGDGEWWISFRGLSMRDDRFSAWAGAGIVAESDPIAEREETGAKMAAVLAGLGELSG